MSDDDYYLDQWQEGVSVTWSRGPDARPCSAIESPASPIAALTLANEDLIFSITPEQQHGRP